MALDFNNAGNQQNYDLIPENTIAPLVMNIRPGGAGEGGWFKSSSSSDVQMLDCEFVIASGPYAGRKIWRNMTVSGGKVDEHGNSIGGNITRATLRAILESARNVKPQDMSETAMQARRINSWQDFCGLSFLAKIGIGKGKNGYEDKNKIKVVITPDMKDYAHCATPSAAPAAPAQTQPAWGNSAQTPPPATPSTPTPAWAR
ncbi:MAG: hypothetical protein IJU65_07840 [Desulfovibrio sp.]|nr:hypothetical protein [Desulfovibrio sp.]